MIWGFVKQKAQSLLQHSREAVQKRFMVWFSQEYRDDKKRCDYMVCYAKHQLELHAITAYYEYISAKLALKSDNEIQKLQKQLDNLIAQADAICWGKLNSDAILEFSTSLEGKEIIADIEEMTRCANGLYQIFESEAYQQNKERVAKSFREKMLEKHKNAIWELMKAEVTESNDLKEFRAFATYNKYHVFDAGLAGYLRGLPSDELQAVQFWIADYACSELVKKYEEAKVGENASRHADENRHPNIGGEMDSVLQRSDEKGESRHSCVGRNLDQNAEHFNNNDNSEPPQEVWLSSQNAKHFILTNYKFGLPRWTKVLLWVTAYHNFSMVQQALRLSLVYTHQPLSDCTFRQAQGTNLYKPPSTRKRKFQKCLFLLQENCILKLLTM